MATPPTPTPHTNGHHKRTTALLPALDAQAQESSDNQPLPEGGAGVGCAPLPIHEGRPLPSPASEDTGQSGAVRPRRRF